MQLISALSELYGRKLSQVKSTEQKFQAGRGTYFWGLLDPSDIHLVSKSLIEFLPEKLILDGVEIVNNSSGKIYCFKV